MKTQKMKWNGESVSWGITKYEYCDLCEKTGKCIYKYTPPIHFCFRPRSVIKQMLLSKIERDQRDEEQQQKKETSNGKTERQNVYIYIFIEK